MAKTTTKRRHPEHDLGEALDEARGRLSSDEFERVVHAGEEAAERAAVHEAWRWVLWLMVAGGIVAAVVADWRFVIPAALLMVWYSLFYIVAAAGDRADDEEIEVLDKSERRRPE
jgi:hypothetical protein